MPDELLEVFNAGLAQHTHVIDEGDHKTMLENILGWAVRLIDRLCLRTEEKPVSTRWVDINKGDSLCPNYRSRLVAREFHTSEKPEWYAATPPGETLRLMLSKLASDKKSKLMYADVSRAYFYAPAVRPVYVRLPDEDKQPGDDGLVGRLEMSMYGTRDAANNWAAEYTTTLEKAGYTRGVANPCLFFNKKNRVSVMVHGDDSLTIGDKSSTDSLKIVLTDAYKVKCEMLGGDNG